MTPLQLSHVYLSAALQCLQDCERCLESCDDPSKYADCLKICRECADICQLFVYLLLQKVPLANKALRILAETCRRCMLLCSQYAEEVFQHCAQSSQHCAELIAA